MFKPCKTETTKLPNKLPVSRSLIGKSRRSWREVSSGNLSAGPLLMQESILLAHQWLARSSASFLGLYFPILTGNTPVPTQGLMPDTVSPQKLSPLHRAPPWQTPLTKHTPSVSICLKPGLCHKKINPICIKCHLRSTWIKGRTGR